MKPLIGVLHTRNLSSAAWILISCAVVQIRMRVLQPVQKCLVLFCKMQSLNFTVTKLDLHVDYLHYFGVAFFLSLLFLHIFKVAFLCSLLSHCFNCTNGKIWEPSGGQNNICKSHSALSTSAWSSDRVKLYWVVLLIGLITFFFFGPCTFVHNLYVIASYMKFPAFI